MGSNNQYLKVGYQGDIGSFSEEAMYEYFTKIKENKKYNNFEDLFIALNDKKRQQLHQKEQQMYMI